jgi:acetoin utilization protein AcuA
MPHKNQKRFEWSTRRGKVIINSFCSPDEIASLSFIEAYTKYARYRSIVSKKETLIKAASQPDTNVTLAFTPDGKIIGFGILEYSHLGERWQKVGDRIMMEVSVIEVGRPWRSLGISKKILRFLVDHPLKEGRIFYMVGYSWTWDLEKISAMDYRNMLIRIFSQQGFKTFQTNEPNIMMRPENLFMARIGVNISEAIQKRFKQVRFDFDLHG